MPEQRDRSHKPVGEELKRMWAERDKRQAAEEAARKEALQIVERWNSALAAVRGGRGGRDLVAIPTTADRTSTQ